VYISYGERSNDQLLQYYGFIEPNNVHDVYELDNLPRRIADAASELAVACPGLDAFAKNAPSSPALVTPTGLDPSLLTEMETVCGGEAQARAVLKCVLEQEMAKFVTSFEEDEALIKSGNSSGDSPRALALALRVEKKRLLAKNIAALSC
jgi:hypothetical protein